VRVFVKLSESPGPALDRLDAILKQSDPALAGAPPSWGFRALIFLKLNNPYIWLIDGLKVNRNYNKWSILIFHPN
jgi:hypothetical protein